MPSRIVVFGATGYTGRLCAERLVARGERPLLAGRSEARLAALGSRLGLEWRVADVRRPATGVRPGRAGRRAGDARSGRSRSGARPAVRAAIAAPRRLPRLDGRARLHPPRARGARAAGGARGRRRCCPRWATTTCRARSPARWPWRRRARRPSASTSATTRSARGPGMLSRGTAASLVGRAPRADVRLPRRAAARRRGRRAGALVPGGRARAAGRLDRRRRALLAPGRLPAAARGQRVPRLGGRAARRPCSSPGSRVGAGHARAGRARPRCGSAASSSPPGSPRPRRARRPARRRGSSPRPTTARAAAGRGAPPRRRRLRVHGGVPRLGGEPGRVARASTARRGRARRGVRRRGARARVRRGGHRARVIGVSPSGRRGDCRGGLPSASRLRRPPVDVTCPGAARCPSAKRALVGGLLRARRPRRRGCSGPRPRPCRRRSSSTPRAKSGVSLVASGFCSAPSAKPPSSGWLGPAGCSSRRRRPCRGRSDRGRGLRRRAGLVVVAVGPSCVPCPSSLGAQTDVPGGDPADSHAGSRTRDQPRLERPGDRAAERLARGRVGEAELARRRASRRSDGRAAACAPSRGRRAACGRARGRRPRPPRRRPGRPARAAAATRSRIAGELGHGRERLARGHRRPAQDVALARARRARPRGGGPPPRRRCRRG